MLADADLDELLAEAKALEASGRTSDALVSLLVVASELLDRGKTYQYVFEWMAQLQCELGEYADAEASAIVARKIAEDADHAAGMFRMDVLRAQIACQARDLAQAERLLAGLRGAGPPCGALSSDRRDAIVAWLRALQFPDLPQDGLAALRVELAVCIAGVWSERGKYVSALAVLEAAEPDLPAATRTIDEPQLQLRRAELLLAAGRLDATFTRLDAIAPSSGIAQLRVAVVRTRAALAAGRLAVALAQLEILAKAPIGDPSLFAAATLARLAVQVELNVHDVAQRTIDDAIARATAAGAPRHTLDVLHLARRDARARRQSTLLLWEQPNAIGAPDPPDELAPGDPRDDADGPAPGALRYAPAWIAAANRVVAALERQDVAAASREHATLAALVRGAESELIDCRVELSAALVAHYRGTATAARFLALADRFAAIGARTEHAQAVRFASWAAARRGALEDYARLARRSAEIVDAIGQELDPTHRALFLLNKWTGADELVSVLVRNLLRDRRDRPRRASRRRLCRGFREVEQLTRWPVGDALGEAQAATLTADAPPDRALAWVREQLAGAPPRDAITLRWWPSLWWFPADTLVLHYHMLADRTFLFRIARGHIEVAILKIGRIHFTEPSTARLDKDSLRQLASELGVTDLWRRFPGIKRLIVIPHDAIASTPFAALRIGDDRLCDLVPVTQVDRLSRVRRGRAGSLRAEHALIAARTSYTGSGLADLPGAAQEADAVHEVLAARRAVCRDPTRRELLAALADVTHLHVAAHGVFDADDPARSGIVLGDGAGGYETLTLHELRRTDLRRLQLATLATCRSAEHASLPGRERICLPTALLDAGARGVIASLWAVDDAASIAVMTALYRELRHQPPSVALAATQRAMGDRPASQWAGLVFYGND